MKAGICALFLLALQFAPHLLGAVSPSARRSISSSRQFIVYCDNRALRQQLTDDFDEIRRQLLEELGLQNGADTPVLVNIQPLPTNQPNARPQQLRWIDTPDGPRVQLDLFVTDDAQNIRLREAIIEALLITLKYRDHAPPDADLAIARPPGWMIEGFSEKFKINDQQLDVTVYRGLLNHHQMPDLPVFLAEDPATLDPTALGIYRAYACALLALLQDQPAGKPHLVEYLQKVPSDRTAALDLLNRTFPQISDTPASFLKWWTLSLARLSSLDRYTMLSAPETEKQLVQALTLHLPADAANPAGTDKTPKTFTVDQFAEFQKNKQVPAALGNVQNGLLRLSLRGNPLYRPVLDGYRTAVSLLQRGKTKDLEQKLASLAVLRQQILQRVEDVADYLNWVEATQVQKPTGEFDGYLNLVNSYDQPRPPSKEPIGKYLDALEAELKN